MNDELERICRKRSWPNFKVLSRNLPGGTEGKHEKSITIAGRWGLDLNPGPPEYEVGVLTTRLRRWVEDGEGYLNPLCWPAVYDILVRRTC
jgi:hypothetical protein